MNFKRAQCNGLIAVGPWVRRAAAVFMLLTIAALPTTAVSEFSLPPFPAEGKYAEYFAFYEYATGNALENLSVHLELAGANESKEAVLFLQPGERNSLSLDPGVWKMKAWVSNPDTEVASFFRETEIRVQNSSAVDIYMFPAGSMSGKARGENNESETGAEVSLSCPYGGNEFREKTTTDSFGDFSFPFAPAAQCLLQVKGKSGTVSASVEVLQGRNSEIAVAPSKPETKPNDAFQDYYLIFAIAALALAAAAFFITEKRARKLEKQSDAKPREPQAPRVERKREIDEKTMGTILPSFDSTSQRIMRCIASKGGRTSQAEIEKELFIPKSTLSVSLRRLEQRQIIKRISTGYKNQVALEDRFFNNLD